MTNRTQLQTLQYWMTEVVMGNGPYSPKLKLVETKYDLAINEVVKSSMDISVERRLWVYEAGFAARLLECLRADYPQLLMFLKDEAFDQLARAYIYYEKPGSYTLFDLGVQFPVFLRNTMPPDADEQLKFIVDLAHYERTFLEVIRAKGAEKIHEEVDTEIPFLQNMFDYSDIRLLPCVRLLELDFPIKEYVNLSEEEKDLFEPYQKKQFVAISRKAYRMKVTELDAWQFYFLKVLQENKNTEEALSASASRTSLTEDEVYSELLLFRSFARENALIF